MLAVSGAGAAGAGDATNGAMHLTMQLDDPPEGNSGGIAPFIAESR